MQRKPVNIYIYIYIYIYIFVDNGGSFDEGNWTPLSDRFEMP